MVEQRRSPAGEFQRMRSDPIAKSQYSAKSRVLRRKPL
jgi:hypothetical protein